MEITKSTRIAYAEIDSFIELLPKAEKEKIPNNLIRYFKEEKDKRIRLHHRIAILRVCNFSVRKILLFQTEYMIQMYALMKEDEFNQLMQKFRSACKRMTS